MADILTSADIAELRRDWVVDEIDERQEWGSGGAKVATGAIQGAASVALTGLGSGTLRRSTPFLIRTGTLDLEYAVATDVTIVAGAATVSVAPLLKRDVATNDAVRAVPYYRSTYNRVFQKLLFSDVQIEDFARQTEERWGRWIHNAMDVRRTRFKAIGALAIRAKLSDSLYESAVYQMEAQDGGRGHLERLERLAQEFESEVTFKATGPAFIPCGRP